MASIDAIRNSVMLVLSALLAVGIVATLVSAAESAAGVTHERVHHEQSMRQTITASRSGAAWTQSVGRRHAQRQRSRGVVRGQSPRPIQHGMQDGSPRN